jgi:hypothetical protein
VQKKGWRRLRLPINQKLGNLRYSTSAIPSSTDFYPALAAATLAAFIRALAKTPRLFFGFGQGQAVGTFGQPPAI